jgi:hypothetical protein
MIGGVTFKSSDFLDIMIVPFDDILEKLEKTRPISSEELLLL